MWYKERCSTVGRCRTRLGAQRLAQCQTSICRESLVLSAQKDEGDQHTTSARQTCLRCLSTHNSQNLHLKTAANMQMPLISLIAAFFVHFSKVHISHILPHKLAFSTEIFNNTCVSVTYFYYLDHLVANRMAPTMCLDLCGTRWGSWFQAILYHISAYLVFMRHKNDMRKQIRATKVKCVAYKWLHTFLSRPGVNILASILPLQT